jgi:hypothetical protein
LKFFRNRAFFDIFDQRYVRDRNSASFAQPELPPALDGQRYLLNWRPVLYGGFALADSAIDRVGGGSGRNHDDRRGSALGADARGRSGHGPHLAAQDHDGNSILPHRAGGGHCGAVVDPAPGTLAALRAGLFLWSRGRLCRSCGANLTSLAGPTGATACGQLRLPGHNAARYARGARTGGHNRERPGNRMGLFHRRGQLSLHPGRALEAARPAPGCIGRAPARICSARFSMACST